MTPRVLPSKLTNDPVVVVRCDFWGFNSIGMASGGEACVIDPGILPVDVELLRKTLQAPVREVLLTHSHHDHIRCWQCFPGAKVSMPRMAAEKPQDARERIVRAKRKIDEKFDVEDPAYTYPVADRVFDERLELQVGDQEVEMIFVPGHSNCTSVVLLPEVGTLCTADYLVKPGLPYCRWQASEFEQAIQQLKQLCVERKVERIIPAHGRLIHGAEAIQAALEEEASYFRALRAEIDKEARQGAHSEAAAQRAARSMSLRRGKDLHGRERQDLDNARRVLAELETS